MNGLPVYFRATGPAPLIPGQTLVDQFWDALGSQRQWINRPVLMWDDPIWKITVKEGFLFDDPFWAVFDQFPFRICHVSYSGAPWSQEGGPPEMVMRFTLRGKEYADVTD